MPDRHFELPAHPDLEYYRKQAKHLRRTYAAGDAAAQARVADVLGDRGAGRFLLSDAQFVLAQEHGFRTWARFRAHIQSRGTAGDRPVSRLSGIGPGSYASMADVLLTYAACGRLDLVLACFDADGRLQPDAAPQPRRHNGRHSASDPGDRRSAHPRGDPRLAPGGGSSCGQVITRDPRRKFSLRSTAVNCLVSSKRLTSFD